MEKVHRTIVVDHNFFWQLSLLFAAALSPHAGLFQVENSLLHVGCRVDSFLLFKLFLELLLILLIDYFYLNGFNDSLENFILFTVKRSLAWQCLRLYFILSSVPLWIATAVSLKDAVASV